MNGLEKMVPPLELCKLIPAGEFADSVLVWAWDEYIIDDPNPTYTVWEREQAIDYLGSDENCIPAPPLDELAQETPGGIIVNFGEHYVESCKYDFNGESMHEEWTEKESAATAALRLWMRIRKAERE